MKECLQCKIEFEPKKPKAKFCSAKCRVYFHRNQVSEASKKSIYPLAPSDCIAAPDVKLQNLTQKTEVKPVTIHKMGIMPEIESSPAFVYEPASATMKDITDIMKIMLDTPTQKEQLVSINGGKIKKATPKVINDYLKGKPERLPKESGIDYSIRLAEWKEKQNLK